MKFNINDTPTVLIKWIDECILSKTTEGFVKVATTFAVLNYKSTIDDVVIKFMSTMADEDGYIDIDYFCDNLTKSIDTVGDSVDIPMKMFFNIPFVSSLTINITKHDVEVMKNLMRDKGVSK